MIASPQLSQGYGRQPYHCPEQMSPAFSPTPSLLSQSQTSFNSLMSTSHTCGKEIPRHQRKTNNSNILTSFHFARLMRISAPILPASISASQIDWDIPEEEMGKFKLNQVYVYLGKRNSNRFLMRSQSNPKSLIVNKSMPGSYSEELANDQIFLFDNVITSNEDMPTICSKVLSPLLESVVVRQTSCTLLNVGANGTQKSKVMIGRDDNHLTPGLIPSAISWLYRLVRIKSEVLNKKYIVKVSFVEVSKNKLRDLLKHLSKRKDEKLRKMEDTTVNLVRNFMDNRTVMKASTSDQAAYLFDEAMRYRVNQWKSITDDDSSTHLIFSLYIYRQDSTDQEFISKLNILDMGSDYNKLIIPNCKQLLRDPRKFENLNLLESTLHYFTTRGSCVKMNTVLLGHVTDDGNEYYENIQVLKTLSKIYKRNASLLPKGEENLKVCTRPKLGQSSFSRSSVILEPRAEEVYEASSKRSTTSSVSSIFKIWRKQKSTCSSNTSIQIRRSTPRTNVKAWPNKSTVLLGKEALRGKKSETWVDGPRVMNGPVVSQKKSLLNLPNLDFSSNEEDQTETALSDISERTEKSRNKLLKAFKRGPKKNITEPFQPLDYSSPKMNRVVDWVNSIESHKKAKARRKQYSTKAPSEVSLKSHNSLRDENISLEVSKICESLITQPQNNMLVTQRNDLPVQRQVVNMELPMNGNEKQARRGFSLFSCLKPAKSTERICQVQPGKDLVSNQPVILKNSSESNSLYGQVVCTTAKRKSLMSSFAAPSSGYDSMPGNDGSESEMSSFKLRQQGQGQIQFGNPYLNGTQHNWIRA